MIDQLYCKCTLSDLGRIGHHFQLLNNQVEILLNVDLHKPIDQKSQVGHGAEPIRSADLDDSHQFCNNTLTCTGLFDKNLYEISLLSECGHVFYMNLLE